jgi:hypothetical protein
MFFARLELAQLQAGSSQSNQPFLSYLMFFAWLEPAQLQAGSSQSKIVE